MTDEVNQETDEYTPPATLPRPVPPDVPNIPVIAICLGLLASVGLGLALFVASQLIYIYLLYNSIIGIGIGIVVAWGIGKTKYHSVPILLLLTATCSLLAYLTFNVALMTYILSEVPGETLEFIEFIRLRAENEPFIGGMEIGAIGNYVVWTIEMLITWYFAWARVSSQLRVMDVEAVPAEVTELIVYLLNSEQSVDGVRRELAARGWTDSSDQDRALLAVTSLASLLQDKE